MSGFSDIADGNLSYTCRCGWIDWGHALPGGATSLREQFMQERSNNHGIGQFTATWKNAPAFFISYGQSMSARPRVPFTDWRPARITAGTSKIYLIEKGLSLADRESAALGIFLSASHDFETMQASFPYAVTTDSGYSMEDLVSNIVGFYIAWRGMTVNGIKALCNEVSVVESERLWKKFIEPLGGIGAEEAKNRTTTPRLFPSDACSDTSFPDALQDIVPARRGTTWQQFDQLSISPYAYIDGGHITVSPNGQMSLTGGPPNP